MTRGQVILLAVWPMAFTVLLGFVHALATKDALRDSLLAAVTFVTVATVFLVVTYGVLRLLPPLARPELLIWRETLTVLGAALKFSLLLQFIALAAGDVLIEPPAEGGLAAGILPRGFIDDFLRAAYLIALYRLLLWALQDWQTKALLTKPRRRAEPRIADVPGSFEESVTSKFAVSESLLEEQEAPSQANTPRARNREVPDELRMSCKGDDDAGAELQAPSESVALIGRFPELLGCRVWALEAQEHYVKVYTDSGDKTLHFRFSHAVADLAKLDGLQVHRSYWVNREAVIGHSQEGRRLLLKLCNGLKVPVSQSFKRAAVSAGLLKGGSPVPNCGAGAPKAPTPKNPSPADVTHLGSKRKQRERRRFDRVLEGRRRSERTGKPEQQT